VATPGFDLPARFVIHTVGPDRRAGQTDPTLLASCFRESLRVGREAGARSIAFPAVSAGVYGWAADEVARIAVDMVRAETGDGDAIELVRFVLFSQPLLSAFDAALAD
jgi:O-acetyl-ADP-ribose deacetylase (regulator of RNase III)